MPSCFSLVSFYGFYLHRCFVSAGLHRETHEIDGGEITIHCWTSDPAPGDEKPTLVLIHGFGPAAVWQWRRQVGPLSRRFRLVVPDLIFFGGSTTRSPHRSEVFQAASVVKLLDLMGIGRFSAVGTSYGGFVAYHAARMCGAGRVERVVIASSDVAKTVEDSRALLERAGVAKISDLMLPQSAAALRTLVGLTIYKPPRAMPDFVMRDILRTLYADKIEEKLELLEGIAVDKDGGSQISPLPQEVLIVWGEHDGIFPLEKAYKLEKLLGEKARLVVMKNTAHLPQVEDPDRFNAIVGNFLLGNPGSSKKK